MSDPTVIHSNPNILGGTPVFVGTRVPVQTLLDYLEGGESLDTFLNHFPSVGREQAVAILELAARSRLAPSKPPELRPPALSRRQAELEAMLGEHLLHQGQTQTPAVPLGREERAARHSSTRRPR